MNIVDFEQLFDTSVIELEWVDGGGCNLLRGLNIINSYLPNPCVEYAECGVIYSACVEEIITAGINIDDTKALRALGWFIKKPPELTGGKRLACFY